MLNYAVMSVKMDLDSRKCNTRCFEYANIRIIIVGVNISIILDMLRKICCKINSNE